MNNTVFLNSAKVDFDKKLDFSPINKLTTFTAFDFSSEEEILDRVKGQNIIITKEMILRREIISKFPDTVKLICEAGTGFNNIDIEAAKERGITVCNIPGYSSEAVAQLVITFILSFCSSLVQQQIMLNEGNLENFTNHLAVPHFEIQGKTLGIIGAGGIGSEVMKVARALGMNILVYSRSKRTWEDSAINSATLEELLTKSDFVTIHCPLTDNTRHLINKERLKLMKPSAFIINTARGPIIKETDLIEALEKGRIAGAALDVQDPEPPETDSLLFRMKNVILTPHIGWKCIESRQRLVNLIALNIKAFNEGRPINTVN